jgi:hypothetical protein
MGLGYIESMFVENSYDFGIKSHEAQSEFEELSIDPTNGFNLIQPMEFSPAFSKRRP